MKSALQFLYQKKKFWLPPLVFGGLLLVVLVLADADGENGFFYTRF